MTDTTDTASTALADASAAVEATPTSAAIATDTAAAKGLLSKLSTFVKKEFHELADHEKALVTKINAAVAEVHTVLDSAPVSREIAIAKTKLQEVIMWVEQTVGK